MLLPDGLKGLGWELLILGPWVQGEPGSLLKLCSSWVVPVRKEENREEKAKRK